jgi:hypothetical protein
MRFRSLYAFFTGKREMEVVSNFGGRVNDFLGEINGSKEQMVAWNKILLGSRYDVGLSASSSVTQVESSLVDELTGKGSRAILFPLGRPSL